MAGLEGEKPNDRGGFVLPYPFKNKFYNYTDPDLPVLGEFLGETPIELTLPDGVKVTDLKWISVWCRLFSINFGDFIFPKFYQASKVDLEPEFQPEPQEIEELLGGTAYEYEWVYV